MAINFRELKQAARKKGDCYKYINNNAKPDRFTPEKMKEIKKLMNYNRQQD